MSAENFIQVMRRLIAKEVAGLLPSWRWGEVTATTPLTVELDAEQGTLTHIASTVGGLAVGDRVEVRTWKSRSLVTGRAGGENDSGWVDCTYVSGDYTAGTPGQLQVRRIGKTVYIRGGAQGPITHATYTPVATIPDGFRPNTILRTGGAAASGRHSLVEITAAGSVNIAWHNYSTSTAAPAWAAVATAYTTD